MYYRCCAASHGRFRAACITACARAAHVTRRNTAHYACRAHVDYPTVRASFVRNTRFIDFVLLLQFLIILPALIHFTHYYLHFICFLHRFVEWTFFNLINQYLISDFIWQINTSGSLGDWWGWQSEIFIVQFKAQAGHCTATTKACPRLGLPMKMTGARDNADHPVRYMQKSRLHQQKIEFRDWSRMRPFYGSGRRQLPTA